MLHSISTWVTESFGSFVGFLIVLLFFIVPLALFFSARIAYIFNIGNMRSRNKGGPSGDSNIGCHGLSSTESSSDDGGGFFSDLGGGGDSGGFFSDLGGAFNRTSLGLKPLVVNWDVC